MTRRAVLSINPRCESAEYYQPALRNPSMLHSGVRRIAKHAYEKIGDGDAIRRVGDIFAKLLYPEKKDGFRPKTELAVKAACAQYLGRYPCETPSDFQIKRALKEMDRMHGNWKAGFLNMEMAFGDMRRIISEVEKYAKNQGLLPKSR